jgi:hypothetical protein
MLASSYELDMKLNFAFSDQINAATDRGSSSHDNSSFVGRKKSILATTTADGATATVHSVSESIGFDSDCVDAAAVHQAGRRVSFVINSGTTRSLNECGSPASLQRYLEASFITFVFAHLVRVHLLAEDEFDNA